MKAVMILFAFLTAWVEKDFKTMFGHTSKTWSDQNKPDDLKGQLSSVIPSGFDIGKIENTSPTTATIEVTLEKDGKFATLSINLVKESWPGKSDPYGDWGILPESIKISASKFKKDESNQEDDLVALRAKADELGIKYFKKSTAEEIKLLIEDLEKQNKAKADEEKAKLEEEKGKADEGFSLLKAKAEDLGIEVPEDATAEELEKLIQEAESGGGN